MFIVKREETYKCNLGGKEVEHCEKYTKKFLDNEFISILDFISSKGLDIYIPSKLDGWDATFVYRKLSEDGHGLGPPADKLALFLYMRLDRKNPVWVEHKGLLQLSV